MELSQMPQKRPALTNEDLYRRQMRLLQNFLEHGAITAAQYAHSAGELTRKMRPRKDDRP